MTESEWLATADPEIIFQPNPKLDPGRVLDFLRTFTMVERTKQGTRKLCLFACACARRYWAALNNRSRTAVEIAERYADGLASKKEMGFAWRTTVRPLERGPRTPDAIAGDVAEPGAMTAAMLASNTSHLVFSGMIQTSDQGGSPHPQVGLPVALALLNKLFPGAPSPEELVRHHMHKKWASHPELRRLLSPEVSLPADYLQGTEKEETWRAATWGEQLCQAALIRDPFGNPFRPVALCPSWLTVGVRALARAIYEDRTFDLLPLLADALEEAGCTNPAVLDHCRDPGEHVRGCWALDLVLGKS
jgi:hypothetical protein